MGRFNNRRRISVATTRTSSTRFDRDSLTRGEQLSVAGPELESRTASTELEPRQADLRLGGTAESVQERQDEIAEDIIEEREEILEESGRSSEETDIIGEDPNEPAIEIKQTLSVLYGFRGTYTSEGFLQSFSPAFERISREGQITLERRKKISRTRIAGRDSILIAKTEYKSGRIKLDDYKALTEITEPSLDINTRRFSYYPKERDKLDMIISQSRLSKEDMLNTLFDSLQIPQYEQTEATVITNKVEPEDKFKFRLSPIEDEPISPRERIDRPDVRGDRILLEETEEGMVGEAIGPGDRQVQRGFDPRFELPESERPRPPRGPTLGGETFRDTSLIEEADLTRRFGTEAQGGSESTLGEQAPGGAQGGYQSGD